jgi:uncharacterized protein (DUF58 family)
MRPTRRGLAALAVGVGALLFGARFGITGLNAFVVPVLVGYAVGAVQLYRAPTPTVERSTPPAGFPGERRTVALDVTAPLPLDLEESVPERLRAADATVVGPNGRERADAGTVADDHIGLSLPGDATVRLDCDLLGRGVHDLGPATARVRDSLGLLTTETDLAGTGSVVVYPDVVGLTDAGPLAGLVAKATADDRVAFDELREYVPGDPLRDVNWKASARETEGDLVVTEYAAADEGGITVAGEAGAEHVDEMARAVGSIATHLLDADLIIGVRVPAGEVDEDRGETARNRVLELLARTGPGAVDGDAAVLVRAGPDGVTVTVGDRTIPFDRLAGEPTDVSMSEPEQQGLADRVRGVMS